MLASQWPAWWATYKFYHFYIVYVSSATSLVCWKIIFHAFINGYSHFVTGILASNDSGAQTVLEVCLDAINAHEVPSWV